MSSLMICRSAALVCLTMLAAAPAPVAAAATEPRLIDGPVRQPALVGWIDAAKQTAKPLERLPGITIRELDGDPATGRLAAVATLPRGYSLQSRPRLRQSLDIVVLEGAVRLGSELLGARDFAFVPPDSALPVLISEAGAELLMFFDPPVNNAKALEQQRLNGVRVTRFAAVPWTRSTLVGSAGADLPLQLKFLKRDEHSGARTWYVQLPPGIEIPWERHSVGEEGFLIEGDYFLNECLDSGTLSGPYRPGGYFRRAPGIGHSGPGSGTRTGVIWLQRSSAPLDVQFFARCERGALSEPLKGKD